MFFHYIDHNECNITDHGCQQECVNTPGSFFCTCLVGYQLNGDNKTCSGKIEKTETMWKFSKILTKPLAEQWYENDWYYCNKIIFCCWASPYALLKTLITQCFKSESVQAKLGKVYRYFPYQKTDESNPTNFAFKNYKIEKMMSVILIKVEINVSSMFNKTHGCSLPNRIADT